MECWFTEIGGRHDPLQGAMIGSMFWVLPILNLIVQEILEYLSMFTDCTEHVHMNETAFVHPADLVLDAFKDEETAGITCSKLCAFLQEAHAVHGKKFDHMEWPESSIDITYVFFCILILLLFVMLLYVIFITGNSSKQGLE